MKNSFFIVLLPFLVFSACRENIVDTESGFADVNGIKLYYEVSGSGEALVLVHGNFGDCRHWDYNFEGLAGKFRVIRYDVRGYGRSDSSPKGFEYKDHADLKALLDYLEIKKAHIAGFSMGSGIVINFALEYPEMCKSLIPVGPWVCGYTPSSIQEFSWDFGQIPSIIEKGGTDAAAEKLIEFPLFKAEVSSDEVKEFITRVAKDYSFLHWTGEGPTRIEPDAVNMLDRIQVPTLIVTSEYDINACLEIAGLLDEKIENSMVVSIPGATHFMMMDHPQEFNDALVNFILSQ
jgi:pimeloyl-ACP methyl ester carboxylesterase